MPLLNTSSVLSEASFCPVCTRIFTASSIFTADGVKSGRGAPSLSQASLAIINWDTYKQYTVIYQDMNLNFGHFPVTTSFQCGCCFVCSLESCDFHRRRCKYNITYLIAYCRVSTTETKSFSRSFPGAFGIFSRTLVFIVLYENVS